MIAAMFRRANTGLTSAVWFTPSVFAIACTSATCPARPIWSSPAFAKSSTSTAVSGTCTTAGAAGFQLLEGTIGWRSWNGTAREIDERIMHFAGLAGRC